ncbi:KRSC protein, partial [Polioptila caerulea]|nr:KRSC protein [Polioptila caerulea]
CGISCPQPVASAWNQPCVTSCGDSQALIHPPPVLVTFPGPILSSCPQQSLVGSSAPSDFPGCGNFPAFGGRSWWSHGSSGG